MTDKQLLGVTIMDFVRMSELLGMDCVLQIIPKQKQDIDQKPSTEETVGSAKKDNDQN